MLGLDLCTAPGQEGVGGCSTQLADSLQGRRPGRSAWELLRRGWQGLQR